MDVRILATATRQKGGREGDLKNVVTLIEQSGDLNPPLYIITLVVMDRTGPKHWCGTDIEARSARDRYDSAVAEFISDDVDHSDQVARAVAR